MFSRIYNPNPVSVFRPLVRAHALYVLTNKSMNKLLTLLLALSCVSCATYLRGDLESNKIAQKGIAINFSETQGGKKTGVAYVGNSRYDIDATYRTGGIGDGAAPYLTIFTLGLLPIYSTNNGDIDYVIRKNGQLIHSGRLDSRFHTTYGWIAISSAESNPSEDLMNWHEGASMSEQIDDTLNERFSRYLANKLK